VLAAAKGGRGRFHHAGKETCAAKKGLERLSDAWDQRKKMLSGRCTQRSRGLSVAKGKEKGEFRKGRQKRRSPGGG